MKNLPAGWTLLVGVGMFLGACTPSRMQQGMEPLPAEPEVIRQAAGQVGGAAWTRLSSLEGEATIVLYSNNQRFLLPATMDLSLEDSSLVFQGATPLGSWEVRTGLTGSVRTLGRGLDEQRMEELGRVAQTYLRRFMGVWLLAEDTHPAGEVQERFVGGLRVKRLGVQGPGDERAFYFDQETNRLVFVTGGSDTPSGKGTITGYEYEEFSQDLELPETIRAWQIGDYVLKGDAPVWSVQLENVTLR